MKFGTGQTIYDIVASVDVYNNPVSGATFNTEVLKNGSIYTGVTVNLYLADAENGLFTSNWSGDTTGDYQLFYKNNITNVLYISNIVYIRPDSELSTNVYIGL